MKRNHLARRNESNNKKDAEIERLMAIEIPSGLSKAERSKRVAERTAKIAKLRNDAKSDKAKISSDAKTDKASVRTDATNKKVKVSSDTKEEKAENQANAKSERAKVSSELKAAVKSVREAYKAAKLTLIRHMNKPIRMNLTRFSQSTRRSRNQRKSLPAHQRRHRIRYRTISENRRKIKMKYDFGGWATRNDLQCADGRVIKKRRFQRTERADCPVSMDA